MAGKVPFMLCGASLSGVPLKPAGKAVRQEIQGLEKRRAVGLLWRLDVTVSRQILASSVRPKADMAKPGLISMSDRRKAGAPLAPCVARTAACAQASSLPDQTMAGV